MLIKTDRWLWAAFALRDAVKRLEQALLIVGANARAVVADAQRDRVIRDGG